MHPPPPPPWNQPQHQPQYPQQHRPQFQHQYPPQFSPHYAPGAGEQAHLVLDVRRHWMGFALAAITPMIVVDGRPMPGRWGVNPIPLPPGQHHLHVHLPYIMPSRIGPADLTLWLQPGAALEVEYRAPLWAYAKGSLGPAPQPWSGMGCMIGLLSIPVGFALFMMVVILISVL